MTVPGKPHGIVLVVAAARNNVIGHKGRMPWDLPADLRRFKRITHGKAVIMGRKTFQSIGRLLPGRHNIILSRTPGPVCEGATMASDFAAAMAAARTGPCADADEVMVIGGAEIYALARPLATRIEMTLVDASPRGDTWFDPPEAGLWDEIFREDHARDGEAPAHSFLSFVRRRS